MGSMFKVGDKVRVKEEPNVKGRPSFLLKMEEFKGKVVTIERVSLDDYDYELASDGFTYSIKEDRDTWVWVSEWFEPLFEVGDRVRIKKETLYLGNHGPEFEDAGVIIKITDMAFVKMPENTGWFDLFDLEKVEKSKPIKRKKKSTKIQRGLLTVRRKPRFI